LPAAAIGAAKGTAHSGVQAKRRVVALGATVAQDRLSGFTVLGQILASTASPKDVAGA
jgi:hypothetical protein